MIAFMLCWSALQLLPGATLHTVSTQMDNRHFELVHGVRFANGILAAVKARSLVECALICVHENSCSDFNFGSGECELLAGSAFCRINAPGWTHGYYPTGSRESFDCLDILRTNRGAESGVYTGLSNGERQPIFCDMDTDCGGWTVLQRRQDGSVNFNCTYEEYARGFGELSGEFWLGNRLLHNLTFSRNYSLRVDLEDFENNTAFALYDVFVVNSEADGFRLTVGGYSGTAGDSLADPADPRWYHSGQKFSSVDKDQDSSARHCAQGYKSGWWFNDCYRSHLNGEYHHGGQAADWEGIIWYDWKNDYFLKHTEMKIKLN